MTLISTNAYQTLDQNNQPIHNTFQPSGATQKLNSAGSSTPSAVFSDDKAVLLRIVADAACHYKIAETPVATTDDVYLPADVGEQIRIQAGWKIAVIGTVNFYATILE